MGATQTYREPGLTNREFFTKELLHDYQEIVADSTGSTTGEWDRVWYAAVHDKNTDETWALVVLMHGNRHTFTYKALDETMGPNECHPSRAVLDALTETDSTYAQEWRADARANLAKTKASTRLKPGQTIELATPITFTDGVTASRLTFLERFRFRREDGCVVQLGNSWRKRYAFTVIG